MNKFRMPGLKGTVKALGLAVALAVAPLTSASMYGMSGMNGMGGMGGMSGMNGMGGMQSWR